MRGLAQAGTSARSARFTDPNPLELPQPIPCQVMFVERLVKEEEEEGGEEV